VAGTCYSVYAQIISHFCRTCEISERARQKELHVIMCNRLENNFLKIEAKAYSLASNLMLCTWSS